jgi:hypothetical protein
MYVCIHVRAEHYLPESGQTFASPSSSRYLWHKITQIHDVMHAYLHTHIHTHACAPNYQSGAISARAGTDIRMPAILSHFRGTKSFAPRGRTQGLAKIFPKQVIGYIRNFCACAGLFICLVCKWFCRRILAAFIFVCMYIYIHTYIHTYTNAASPKSVLRSYRRPLPLPQSQQHSYVRTYIHAYKHTAGSPQCVQKSYTHPISHS